MSTYLAPVAGSSSSALPLAPSLSLLPFSLGTASTPFSTDTASTAQYFQPRPCPADVPGIPEGTPTAAFRGRQLVGHDISVPPGYRGFIFAAPLPHQHQQIETKWPLTPAPSVASTSTAPAEGSSSSTRRSPRKSALANVASTIKAKVRGAGQMALSKPKTRQTKKEPVKRKRYQLDSEEEEDSHLEHSGQSAATPKKEASASTVILTEEAELPTIVVQEATPLKEPLPTPKKRLGQRGAISEGVPKKRSRSRSPDGSPTPSSSASTEVSTPVSEAVIPSPATEEDPPAFSVDTLPTELPAPAIKIEPLPTPDASSASIETDKETEDVKPDESLAAEVDAPGSIPADARILKATSTFESFTLWTPDGPLPGFKQDESAEPLAVDEVGEGKEGEGEDGGVKLRKGWWRTGGAGEGGDEIVRALGEWIGLVEELNRPVYLDESKDEESDEE